MSILYYITTGDEFQTFLLNSSENFFVFLFFGQYFLFFSFVHKIPLVFFSFFIDNISIFDRKEEPECDTEIGPIQAAGFAARP